MRIERNLSKNFPSMFFTIFFSIFEEIYKVKASLDKRMVQFFVKIIKSVINGIDPLNPGTYTNFEYSGTRYAHHSLSMYSTYL